MRMNPLSDTRDRLFGRHQGNHHAADVHEALPAPHGGTVPLIEAPAHPRGAARGHPGGLLPRPRALIRRRPLLPGRPRAQTGNAARSVSASLRGGLLCKSRSNTVGAPSPPAER
ncbi:hypothetical protein MRX96_034456 [Rhipicephalus microplus]